VKPVRFVTVILLPVNEHGVSDSAWDAQGSLQGPARKLSEFVRQPRPRVETGQWCKATPRTDSPPARLVVYFLSVPNPSKAVFWDGWLLGYFKKSLRERWFLVSAEGLEPSTP
jgi:hypothetical protein